MSQIRQDPLSGSWAVIASERGRRPHDFKSPAVQRRGPENCPFCPGNEHMTPPEILAYRPRGGQANGPGWTVRVVPNKFPALTPEVGQPKSQFEGVLRSMPGVGAHEVIIESPDHESSLGSHSQEQANEVFKALRDRMNDLNRDQRIEYVQVFKNSGPRAGASLEHTHFQLIATPVIPGTIETEAKSFEAYSRFHGGCLLCDLIGEEKERGIRVVDESEGFIVIAPYASRFPYQTWILPKAHQPRFEWLSDGQLWELAGLLPRVIGGLESLFKDLPYNLVIHTAPARGTLDHLYHWHVDILPRLTTLAGFEFGTGFSINPTAPELAAQVLREALAPAHV